MSSICWKTLLELAQRKYPAADSWYIVHPYIVHPYEFNCLICNKLIQIHDFNSLENHGFKHLKEKGLLIFT